MSVMPPALSPLQGILDLLSAAALGAPPGAASLGAVWLTGAAPLLAVVLLLALLVLGLVFGLLARALAAVALGVAVYLALCYGVLLYTIYREPPGAEPPRRRLPQGLLRAVLSEFAACFLMAFLWPVGLLLRGTRILDPDRVERVPSTDPREAAPPEDGPALPPLPQRRPVLLLHGYGMNSMTWVWLGGALRRRGLGPLYTATYFSPQAVERSAAHLAQVVEEILRREGAQRVDIIAHSLGGIVSRYYIERMGGKVANLVTLGTPHQGTVLSRFGLGPVAAQLGRGATLLDRPVCPPAGVRYLSIYSTADQMVIPCDSARILQDGEAADSGRAELRLAGLGHLSLLVSPEVARLTAAALRRQEERAAGEAAA